MDYLKNNFRDFFKKHFLPSYLSNINIDKYIFEKILPSSLNFVTKNHFQNNNEDDVQDILTDFILTVTHCFVYDWCQICCGENIELILSPREINSDLLPEDTNPFRKKSELLLGFTIKILNKFYKREVKKTNLPKPLQKIVLDHLKISKYPRKNN